MKPTGNVLLLVLAPAFILGVYYILSTENAHRLSRPVVAGWDDIDECGSLRSFDGTKILDFERSHGASLTEKASNDADKPERKTEHGLLTRRRSATPFLSEIAQRITSS